MAWRWLGVGPMLTLGALALAAEGDGAQAATFSDDYLAGRWTTGAVDRCAGGQHEQTVFRDDGTFATERGGEAVAVGFWTVEGGDHLEMRVLASPRAVEPALQERLGEGYGFVRIKALVFDVEDRTFRMVQSVGDVLQGLNVVRCPEAAGGP